mgnify:CR=1 FL=1
MTRIFQGPFKDMVTYTPAVDIYALGIILAKMMTSEFIRSTRSMYVKMPAILSEIPSKVGFSIRTEIPKNFFQTFKIFEMSSKKKLSKENRKFVPPYAKD